MENTSFTKVSIGNVWMCVCACVYGLMYLKQKTKSKFLFQVLSLAMLIDKRLHISFLVSFKNTEMEEKAVDVGMLMIAVLTNHLENTCLVT